MEIVIQGYHGLTGSRKFYTIKLDLFICLPDLYKMFHRSADISFCNWGYIFSFILLQVYYFLSDESL